MQEEEGQAANAEENHPYFLAHIPAAELLEKKIEEARKEKPALVMLGKHLGEGQRAALPRLELAGWSMPFIPKRQRHPRAHDPVPHLDGRQDRGQRESSGEKMIPPEDWRSRFWVNGHAAAGCWTNRALWQA